MTTNGNGRSQWLVNVLLGILLTVLGIMWKDQAKDVREIRETAAGLKVETAQIKSSNDAKWDEVLRRLGRIELKIDKEPTSRNGSR